MPPKKPSQKGTRSKAKDQDVLSFPEVNQQLNEATGKLLESTASMHSFVQALQTSGFRSYVDYLGSPWRSFWINLLFGIARGLGFVIGATVVVAIVIWIISRVLTQLPYVGEFFQTLEEFLTEENIQDLQSGNSRDTINELFQRFKTNVLETKGQ